MQIIGWAMPKQLMLVMLVLLVTVGCGTPSANTSPAPGSEASRSAGPKRIRAAIGGDPWTLSRIMNGNLGRVRGVNELELLLHAGLAVEDEQGSLHPILADAIPSLDNGLWKLLPGGRMETTWRIRPGATWHDGTPFTAEDLVFT